MRDDVVEAETVEDVSSADTQVYELMGFRVTAASAFIGGLIQHQTQLDLIIDQLWALHKQDSYSARCNCGLPRAECGTRSILEAYRRARRPRSPMSTRISGPSLSAEHYPCHESSRSDALRAV